MFNIDGKLWAFLNKMTDLIFLNLLFIIFSLPLFTIGASKAAMYAVAGKLAKDEEAPIFKSFMMHFKENFKASTVIWGVYVLCMFMVSVNVYALTQFELGWTTTLFMTGTTIIFFIINVTFIYAILLNIHFNNTIKNSLFNGSALAIANLPRTVLILAIEYMPITLVFFFTSYVLYIFTFYFIIGFAISAFMNAYVFDQVLERIKNK